MRVVIDPNVFISGLIGKPASSPRRIIDALADDEVQVVATSELLDELQGVLERPWLDKYASSVERSVYMARIRTQVEPVDTPPSTPGATRDPDDDYLVAIARSENVDAIVSGDKDLREADLGFPPVWTPREFMDRLDGLQPDN